MLRVSCEEAQGEVDKSITLTPSVNGNSCSSKIIRITQRGISPCTCDNFSYLGIAAFFEVSGATRGTVVGHYTFDDDVCPASSISFNSVTYIFDETIQDYIVAPDQYDISLGASDGDITLLTDIGENEDTHVRKFVISVSYGNETCGSGYELIQDGAEEQCDCTTALDYYLTSLVRTFPYIGNTEEIIASAVTTCGEIVAMANCSGFFTDPSYPVAVKNGNTILFKAQVADDPTSGGMSSCGVTFQFKGGGVTGETAIQCSRQMVLQRYDYFCRCDKMTINDAFDRWMKSNYTYTYLFRDGYYYKENTCYVGTVGLAFSSHSGADYRKKYECFDVEITDVKVDGVSIPFVNTYPESGAGLCFSISKSMARSGDLYFLNEKGVNIYNSSYYFCSLDESKKYVSVDVYGHIIADGKWIRDGREYYFEGGTKCEDDVLHLRYYRNLGYSSCTQVQSNIIVKSPGTYDDYEKVDDVTSKIAYNFTNGDIITFDGNFGCACENRPEMQIVDNGGFLESDYEEGGIGKLLIYDGDVTASISATNTSNSARTATLKLVYPIGTTNCEKLFYVIQDYFHTEDCIDCSNWQSSFRISDRYSPDYPYSKIGETVDETFYYRLPYPDCVGHFNFGTPTAVTVSHCEDDDGSNCEWIDSSSIAFSSETSSDGLTLNIKISVNIDTYYSSSSSDYRYGYFDIAMSDDSDLASCFPKTTAYFRQYATAPTACTCGSLLSVQRVSNEYMNSNGEFQSIGTDNNLLNIGEFSISNDNDGCMDIIVSSNQSQYLSGLTYSQYSWSISVDRYYIQAIVLPNNTGQPYNFTIDINIKLTTDGSSCGGQNLSYSVLPT
jgi:hypothetical protein